ncbi:unnamed protein product [Caenorhabditis angaria]|uniref:MARVEL domain-containing protein n=1 Tax=Caenorhabditis angaria TaxID=860376 RepID=A0A9P1I6W1_9PELO|nr:unnamed protein product [Caenorhabditis angaria]
MDYSYGAGTVKIIPASAFRDVSLYHQNFGYDYQEPLGHPINGAYYMGGVYNPAYLHEPYGQNGYIDPTYGDPHQHAYYGGGGGYNYSPYNYHPHASIYPGAYGPYPGASGAYRPYPQPQPETSPPRRSRTAPPRPPRGTGTLGAESRRGGATSRGISVDAMDRAARPMYRQHTMMMKPMYRKRREPTTGRSMYHETDFGGGGGPSEFAVPPVRSYYMGPGAEQQPQQQQQQQTLRRLRPFYAPSYTTYPPSTMHHKNNINNRRYPTYARMALKAAQLILGAAIIGLVLGPMKGNTFHDFVIRTNTEWQGMVLGIAVIFSIFSGILLLTSYLANDVHIWRKVDGLITASGCFFWLLAAFVESYYAACYPPNGPRINLVCHRAEWIIACILCFINMVIYVADFVLSWMAGVSML